MGVPVVFLDPRSKGAQAYKAFAWEFMAKNPTRFELPPATPTQAVTPETVVAPEKVVVSEQVEASAPLVSDPPPPLA